MKTSDEYQARAVACLRLAQSISFAQSKPILLEMAQAWVKLAEYARDKETEDAPRFRIVALARDHASAA